MTDTDKTAEGKEQEISVSAEGVTIKGPIVEDIRKPIRRVAGTADSVLRLFHNIVSIPIDYLSTNLEGFRRR